MLLGPQLPSTLYTAPHDIDDVRQHSPPPALKLSLAPLTPLEFVQGSSTSTFAVPPGKYTPINQPRPPHRTDNATQSAASGQPAKESAAAADGPTIPADVRCFRTPLKFNFPQQLKRPGYGLYNTGNSCFVNSVLQCLLHLAPVVNILSHHALDKCDRTPDSCAQCMLRTICHWTTKKAVVPKLVLQNLSKIAKHMRGGRQEDAHEFMRFFIDALQRSALPLSKQKPDPKLAESTWVHQIFGGTLRSRVKCRECGHPSDTFDSILDLSIDVFGTSSLREALHKFVKLDILKGTDSYKCERCRRPVVAEKGFTIYSAPAVLTIHLKRFTPMGRKLTHPVRFDQTLDLKPYMSEGKYGPLYRLVGVICHAGSGPNSGHYYSFVKGDQPNDPFYEINDEMVERAGTISEKSAYILFYQIQKGDSMRQLSFLTQVGATEAYAQERRNHAKPGVTDMIPATVTTPSIKKQGRIETPIPQSVILQEKIRKLEARRSAQGPAASTDEVVSNAEAHDGQVELGESMKLDASQLSEDIGEPIVSQSPSPLKRPPEKSEEMDQAKKQRLSSPLEFNISRGLDLAFTGYTDTTKSHLIFSSSTNTQINKPKGVKQRMKKKSIMM